MTPESAVLRMTLDYLAAKGILAYRMNSSLTVAEYKGKRRAFRSGVVGMADVLAFPKTWCSMCESGTVLPTWLEVKAAKGKQSELQVSFQRQVEAHGHRYAVIRCYEDLEQILR